METKGRKIFALSMVLVIAVGISSRFVNIGTQGILIDETWVVPNTNLHFKEKSIFPKLFTYPQFQSFDPAVKKLIKSLYSLHPIFQVAAYQATDVHPPLFHSLNYYWGQWFGYEMEITRTPAAIYFIFTLFLMLIVMKRQNIDFAARIYILSFLVFSPIYLFFSNFARPYTLLLLLSLLSSYLCYELVTTGFRTGLIFGYVLSSAACLYTHYYGALVITSQAVYIFFEVLIIEKKIKKILPIIIIECTILLLFLPWLFVMILQIKYRYPMVEQGFRYLNFETAVELFLTFGLGYSRSSLYSYHNIVISSVQILLFLIGLVFLWREKEKPSSRFWIFFFIFPLILIIVFNIIKPVFTPRNCSIILIPYLAISGFGLVYINKTRYRVIIFAFICSVGLYSIYYGLTNGNVRGKEAMEDWKSTAELIKGIESSPPVYVYHPAYRDALYYYIPDAEKIRSLEERFWDGGPPLKKFIIVEMKPTEDPMRKKIVKELPFLKNDQLYNVELFGHFPHIYVYALERKSSKD